MQRRDRRGSGHRTRSGDHPRATGRRPQPDLALGLQVRILQVRILQVRILQVRIPLRTRRRRRKRLARFRRAMPRPVRCRPAHPLAMAHLPDMGRPGRLPRALARPGTEQLARLVTVRPLVTARPALARRPAMGHLGTARPLGTVRPVTARRLVTVLPVRAIRSLPARVPRRFWGSSSVGSSSWP